MAAPSRDGPRRLLSRLLRSGFVAVPLILQPSALAAQTTEAASQADAPQRLAQLPLEELLEVKVDTVYAASRLVQEVAHAPASVSIVTAEEIRNHGYRTLADILRNVRGFYVSYDRNYSYVGVRGFARPGDYNSRVLILLNGHQLNDTIFEQALLGTESPIDVALFDRVEVIRGPSSSLYGTNAFFAVVNIVTRSGRAIKGVELDGQGGSPALGSARATLGGRTGGSAEGLVSLTAWRTHGNAELYYPEFDVPPASNGVVRDADGDQTASVFASAAARGFQLQTLFGSRTKAVPTASFGTAFGDPRTKTTDSRGLVDLQYTKEIRPRVTFQGRGSYDMYKYDGEYAYEPGLFRDGAHASWATAETSIVSRFDRHSVTGGFEYRHNFTQDQSAVDWTGVLLDDRRSSTTAALFVEDEFRLNARVLVNAGVRWDQYFSTFGSTVNPRVGLIVFPTSSAVLKILYGRAFRAPNPFELYYEQDASSAALTPERIATSELVWEQRLGRGLQLTASAFHNRVTDLITQRSGSSTSLDGLYYANGGGLSATGAEWEAQVDLPARVRTRFAFVVQSTTDSATGGSVSNSPGRLATAVVDAPVGASSWRIGFNANYVSERHTVRDAVVPGEVLSDLTLSGPVSTNGLWFSFSLRNLFNADYIDPGTEEHRQLVIPQDGRTFSARVMWRFR